MGMKAPVTGNGDGPPREIPPAGTYLAVCNGVYMLGSQPGYQGGDANLQVMLTFQLHKRKGPVKDSQDRIMEASKIMNLTANIKSTLTDYAGALRGHPYDEDELGQLKEAGGLDPEELLGQPCRLTLIHEAKADKSIRDKIKTVAPLDVEDDTAPTVEGDEIYWDWTLGIECPKRIAWFWKRAQENPDREGEPVGAASAKSKPSDVEPYIDAGDIPF